MTATAHRPAVVTPDRVLAPQDWPIPYEGADDPGDHDRDECDDYGGCPWCDQDHWRHAYTDLYDAHHKLIGDVRDAADNLMRQGTPEAQEAGRYLRARLGEVATRRHRRPDRKETVT